MNQQLTIALISFCSFFAAGLLSKRFPSLIRTVPVALTGLAILFAIGTLAEALLTVFTPGLVIYALWRGAPFFLACVAGFHLGSASSRFRSGGAMPDAHAELDTPGWKAGLASGLHIAAWGVLVVGLWFEWSPAQVIGIVIALANISSMFLLSLFNAIFLLIILPLAASRAYTGSLFVMNAAIFLLLSLIVQIWQTLYFLPGAAAH